MALKLVVLLASAVLVTGQRPSFAGSRPIGYPDLANRTTTTSADGLVDRFGSDNTTQRLPIEALGDRDLVDRLSKLPLDQQPFWLINWQALEDHRKNPQTYPVKPGSFVNLFPENSGNSNTNSDLGNRNSGTNSAGNSNTDPLGNRNGGSDLGGPNSAGNTNDLLGNRNSGSDSAGSSTTVRPANAGSTQSTPTTRVPSIYHVVPGVGTYFRR